MAGAQIWAPACSSVGGVSFGGGEGPTLNGDSSLGQKAAGRILLRPKVNGPPMSERYRTKISSQVAKMHLLSPRMGFADTGHEAYYDQLRKQTETKSSNKARKQAEKAQRQAAKAKAALLSAELATTLESLRSWEKATTVSGPAQAGDLEEVVKKLEEIGTELKFARQAAKNAEKGSSSSSSSSESSESSDSKEEKEEKRRKKQAKKEAKLARKVERRDGAGEAAVGGERGQGAGRLTLAVEPAARLQEDVSTETSRRTLEALFGAAAAPMPSASGLSLLPTAAPGSTGRPSGGTKAPRAAAASLAVSTMDGRDVRSLLDLMNHTVALDVSPLAPPKPARVEVCVGGKCKREGALQVLAALQDRLPRGSVAEAVPCSKCMGKCKSAPNVKVRSEGGGSVLEPRMSASDVDRLLRTHFGSTVVRADGPLPPRVLALVGSSSREG